MAAVPLFFTTIVFFANLGTFVLITVFYSLLIALTLVLPLAALIGPEPKTQLGTAAP